MARAALLAAGIFGTWALVWCIVGVVGNPDWQLGAHLWLAFTGAPAALLALNLKSASTVAIFTAAVLGTVQWSALAALSEWCRKRWGN